MLVILPFQCQQYKKKIWQVNSDVCTLMTTRGQTAPVEVPLIRRFVPFFGVFFFLIIQYYKQLTKDPRTKTAVLMGEKNQKKGSFTGTGHVAL